MLESLERFAGLHIDLLSFAFCVGILIVYHVHLRIKLRQHPTYTVQALNNLARTAWVATVMAERRDILAVQTLRNSTMAASFLASTAVLLIIGVLSLSAQGDKLGDTWHLLNLFGTKESALWLAKLLLMTADLFVAFFSFSLSIRVYNHVGYLVNVPLAAGHKAISPAHVAEFLNSGGRYYSIGQRAFYFLVPLVFWLFGPHFMVIATVGLIFVLRGVDRAPRVLEEDYT
ncbi:MAG: DUF599 domain-containing protein [Burkholderiales bacterium]|nr:DUF599 domain-containing protein [Burkholderiales bacterium]